MVFTLICSFSPLEVSTTSFDSVTVWRYNPAIRKSTRSVNLKCNKKFTKTKIIKSSLKCHGKSCIRFPELIPINRSMYSLNCNGNVQ